MCLRVLRCLVEWLFFLSVTDSKIWVPHNEDRNPRSLCWLKQYSSCVASSWSVTNNVKPDLSVTNSVILLWLKWYLVEGLVGEGTEIDKTRMTNSNLILVFIGRQIFNPTRMDRRIFRIRNRKSKILAQHISFFRHFFWAILGCNVDEIFLL